MISDDVRGFRCATAGAVVVLLALGAEAAAPVSAREAAARAPASPRPALALALEGAALSDAAAALGRSLGWEVVVSAKPSHPAHRLRPTLRLQGLAPEALLTAVASAYDLRWMWLRLPADARPARVALVPKSEYWGTPSGMRQAMAEALPAELRPALVGSHAERMRWTEGWLQTYRPEQLATLERLTAGKPVAIGQLPPELSGPMLAYLSARCADRLARACGQFLSRAARVETQRLRYGRAPDGTRRFFFPAPPAVVVDAGGGQNLPEAMRAEPPLPPGPPLPELDRLPLREAASRLFGRLRTAIELRLDPTHPAYRLRPVLRLHGIPPEDAIAAVAAAYGLRWIWLSLPSPAADARTPGRVAFLDDRDFRGTPPGVRHAVAEAMPPAYRGPLVGDELERARHVEAPLRRLRPPQLDELERRTLEGTVAIEELPNELRVPARDHLVARQAYLVGRACDDYFLQISGHRDWRVRYQKDAFGRDEFAFDYEYPGVKGSLVVAPGGL